MEKKPILLYWWAVAALLAIMATLELTSVRKESQTADEGRQLISGYTYLLSGHFTVAREHPPLLKLLWAIPVWFLHPKPPHDGDAWQAAVDFLYRNRTPADELLLAGRCSAIGVSVLLGLAIAFWARRRFGDRAALFAVFLYAADPNFLANGRYIKNDVGAALAIFAGAMTWGEYLLSRNRARLCLSGLVLGLALTVKNSATILLLVLPLLYLVRFWQERRSFQVLPFLVRFGAVALIAFLVIFAVYGFDVEPAGSSPEFARIFPSFLDRVPVPAMAYFRGLGNLGLRQAGNALEVSFLMGEQSPTGWWYMTPVALAVKTPLAELILFALTLYIGLSRWKALRLRDLDFRWYLLAVPAACYLGAAFLPIRTLASGTYCLSIRFYLYSLPLFCWRNPYPGGGCSRSQAPAFCWLPKLQWSNRTIWHSSTRWPEVPPADGVIWSTPTWIGGRISRT